MLRLTKKRAVLAATAVCCLALAAGAYAYFTSTGTGTATATVGPQARLKASPEVIWRDQANLPEFESNARIASDVADGGSE